MREHRYSKYFHQRVGYVWQNPDAQLFCASVEEELAFGPLQMGLPEETVHQRVEDAIAYFSLEKLRDKAPYFLSGGEKKRTALASIFTMNPAVWTLDEPETFLDAESQAWLTQFLQSFKDAGKTIIVTSHHPDIAGRIADSWGDCWLGQRRRARCSRGWLSKSGAFSRRPSRSVAQPSPAVVSL